MFDTSNIIAVGANGVILQSWDSGNNWKITFEEFNIKFNVVEIIDSITAFIGGSNKLYKTIDKGKHWVLQPYFTNLEITDIDFVNSETGYICTPSYEVNRGYIYKTINSGIDWILIHSNTNSRIYKIHFLNPYRGYTAGEYSGWYNGYSVINKTINGGLGWSSYWFGYQSICKNLYFLNSNTGFFSFTYSLFKTTDGGESITSLPISGHELYFTTDGIGYFCTDNIIQKTTDVGVSWYAQNTVSNNLLYSIDFINELTGFACGGNGQIIKTISGGDTTTVQINNHTEQLPPSFAIHQNYPNPFNPVTRINYDIIKISDVRLDIYGISGKHIVNIVNKRQERGSYAVDFDSRFHGGSTGLSSGIYFCVLKAGGYSGSIRMILVK